MRAVLLTEAGIELGDVADPAPVPGQVVVSVDAAGLCHSDLTVAARSPQDLAFDLPVVLGHELAGTVVEVGVGVGAWRVGDRVVGYGPRGCGGCRACAVGAENYCRQRPAGLFPPGLGAPGALAARVAVSARHLVAAPGVDPAQGAALTDAGLTAYHAVRRWAQRESRPADATAVVIGVGGLGHAAIQVLRAFGVASVVAIDITQPKLDLALRVGADHAWSAGPDDAERLRDLTGGTGADLVVDLVASDQSLASAASMLAVDGHLSLVGVGAGRLPVAMHAVPLGTRVDVPFWGTRGDLVDVLALAVRGGLDLTVEEYPLADAVTAYGRMARGELLGRAVVRPGADVA